MPAIAEARRRFSEIVDAARHGHRTAITKNGKPVAVVIPIEDSEYLESLEDAADHKAANAARKESRKKGWVSVTGNVREYIAAL